MDYLRTKKATINMKCSDEESFKWAVARALNPVGGDATRVTNVLRERAEKYNWKGLDFPTSMDRIKYFEKNNDQIVNVFGFTESGAFRVLRIPPGIHRPRVLLLLVDGRYLVVKNIGNLLCGRAATGKERRRRSYCYNCFRVFFDKDDFNEHISSLCDAIKEDCDFCVMFDVDECYLHRANGLYESESSFRDLVTDVDRKCDVNMHHKGLVFRAGFSNRSNRWVLFFGGGSEIDEGY